MKTLILSTFLLRKVSIFYCSSIILQINTLTLYVYIIISHVLNLRWCTRNGKLYSRTIHIRRHTCLTVVAIIASNTATSVSIHCISASTSILTWVVGTLVDVYNIVTNYLYHYRIEFFIRHHACCISSKTISLFFFYMSHFTLIWPHFEILEKKIWRVLFTST